MTKAEKGVIVIWLHIWLLVCCYLSAKCTLNL